MPKFSDYFNSTTNTGRANVAKATYATIAALYLYSRLKRRAKNKPVNPNNSNDEKRNGFLDAKECPKCECKKENTTSDIKTECQQAGHGHEQSTSAPSANAAVQDKTSNDHDDFVAAAETFIKSSQAKCEPRCGNSSQNKRDYEKTSDTII